MRAVVAKTTSNLSCLVSGEMASFLLARGQQQFAITRFGWGFDGDRRPESPPPLGSGAQLNIMCHWTPPVYTGAKWHVSVKRFKQSA